MDDMEEKLRRTLSWNGGIDPTNLTLYVIPQGLNRTCSKGIDITPETLVIAEGELMGVYGR